MYCNGARLNGKFMEEVVDAGIDFIRISDLQQRSYKNG